MCATVSSMLSGLETRSRSWTKHIRHNIDTSPVTVCPSRSSVHRFLGLTSSKQGVNVICSRPVTTNCVSTGPGSNQGPISTKSDALTTAPVHPHKNLSDARETAICNFTGITHISEKDFQILLAHKKGEI